MKSLKGKLQNIVSHHTIARVLFWLTSTERVHYTTNNNTISLFVAMEFTFAYNLCNFLLSRGSSPGVSKCGDISPGFTNVY